MRETRQDIKVKKYSIGLMIGLFAFLMLILPVRVQAAYRVQINESDYDSFRAVFNAEYYYNDNADLQEAIGFDEEKLFQHFVTCGIFEGRSGDGIFCLHTYMKYEDLQAAFGGDYGAYCRHYLEYGKIENRIAMTGNERTEIGEFTTLYDTSEQRAVNVELAAQRVNGTVLQPGEKFSFNKTVLPRTRANGYVLGPSFAGGKEVESIGGGICQVSSTLYASLIMAGIPATERYAHSLPVDYVPHGMDATIAGNSKDLKFVNTLPYPIVINVTAKDGVLTVSLDPYEAG